MSDLVERLRYTHKHGIFDANIAGMLASPNEAAARITELEAQLAAVLDVADETYRKYGGDPFDGFDAADIATIQAARTYWWETCGQRQATAIAPHTNKADGA